MPVLADQTYETESGITILRTSRPSDYETGTSDWIDRLDSELGAVLSSSYEYPGRYTRWDMALVNPPLVLEAADRKVEIRALNDRGKVLIPAIVEALRTHDVVETFDAGSDRIELTVKKPDRLFNEEERSRQPSTFSIVRALKDLFACGDDQLGLYGAFGYDVAFQFEPIDQKLERPHDQRDVVLFLPDEILIVDHHGKRAYVLEYDFVVNGKTTKDLERTGEQSSYAPANKDPGRGDHEPGEYAELVEKAKDYFRRGDLFETVPGQTFYEPCANPPSAVSRRLAQINPSPYSFFFNLGNNEYLVGASPEMYVRVTGGRRVETCPISGTIRRGKNAIEDEAQIRKLLNSAKDEAELTMCSDVDRNDKSRVCVPGSVKVIGRRQIEMYSRLIHTVDHIEGTLREDMDALDAFLSHTWAVTVTGAPKRWAMQFIEDHEKSPRAWYGGAIGAVLFNGDMNTGLTLRTVRIKDGLAQIRAGATLLYDSVPEDEEAETELKAEAMRAAVREAGLATRSTETTETHKPGEGLKILLVDHEDSFVHTLANYFRQTGADVVTYRTPVADHVFHDVNPDLVVLSPGPGNPKDFDCAATIGRARARALPIFGVCLGLQALSEYFGAELGQLDIPMHGKPSPISISGNSLLFDGLNAPVIVGRYHSLFAKRPTLPGDIRVTAETEDGVVMAIEHEKEAIAAVQFHPESIMSLDQDAGHMIIENVVSRLVSAKSREREDAL
ncbi:anthranilate synthase [Labrenzia sp. EL_208]|uniref:Anthranilate synthase n=1 Tax=Roseibium album TaxID=311410 RepID=A0A0M7AQ34_9HYPH|nr:anthranilate synthase component I [Roseibium album]MBG6155774.1 anthranilate synthase [Labrenzia sp. EL_162]MBG6161227.1 anthranilate synthase [Labrenzia sp. EL_195]MBG6177243.1 anthranilate synthase [Labrenzia sp. EL_132]MBG6194308.1 anthranilate synthase [Labrenzia sp. EL_159]MBG6200760.1 anthranilate synthase [Labrenzia sp. EL_13]MBG6205646.1 anthranilate synthase [Labrenzia sp. EL_126]MBG6231864.1 anthranilate synthase [Labrenzia sp. EL_208]MCR9058499.1 anthranilate synthase componen